MFSHCGSVKKSSSHKISCEGSTSDIEGYKFSYVRYICVIIGCILSGGLLRLLFHWFPHWMLWCTHKVCDLNEADKVKIKDISGIYIHKVQYPTRGKPRSQYHNSTTDAFLEKQNERPYIIHKKLKYIWNFESENFELLQNWDERPYDEVLNAPTLTTDLIETRRNLYGINKIDVSLTPIMRLVLNGCLTPFHCFQVFSCVIWFCVEYEIYATCIAVFSVTSLIFQVYELRKNERALKKTVCISSKVTVCRRRDGEDDFMLVDSTELVPGDLIAIPSSGCLMQCDAVLLMGNCIVNESSLTGESLPITKIPLPNGQYENTTFDFRSCPRHILFSGTSVIQTRGDINKRVLAVVIRTGFMTTKGELVRSIMFPKPMKFKFTQDAYQFLGALCGVALVGLCVSVYLMYWNKKELYYIILRPLDLVTIVIPPILPVAMSVGIVFAQRRLRNHGIYCINPSVMNVCGVINLTCFDKTGTLTEDGLDLWGVVPNRDGVLGKPEFEPSKLDYGPLVECMATCHSLTRIDGVLSGDPLDVKMFQSTKWEFIEVISEDQHNFDLVISAIVRPKEDECGDIFEKIPYEIGIVRQFPFSSSVQRMSVITRTLNESQFHIYTKGAPETIEVLCRRDTIPTNFHSNLLEFTREGFRVLALAWRPIKASYLRIMRISRDRVEHNLLFLGLLVMENRLKPESGPVIKTLRQANIRPVMVTGDHMLTSLSVARDCEMIDELDRVVIVTARPPPCPVNDFDSDVLNESQPIPVPNNGLSTEKNPNNIQDATNAGNNKNFSDDLINSLVQFHYAEDLHRPVTEVATTNIQLKRNLTKSDNRETSKQSFSKRLKTRFNFGRLQSPSKAFTSLSALGNSAIYHADSEKVDNHTDYEKCLFDKLDKHLDKSDTFKYKDSAENRYALSIRMIDRPDFHLAISGKTWSVIQEHYPWLIPKLVVKGTVFARFSPEQKAQVIEALQSVGYFVSMCGDGANDCGALKVAHAGISLSEAEASIASPFTSKKQNISCVPMLIREGRCALVTSFGTFKFMAGYSLIQSFSTIILFAIGSNLSEWEFLYCDFVIITTLSLTFGYTHAYPYLSAEPPTMRLLSMVTMISLFGQVIIGFIIQATAFILIRFQSWYMPLYSYSNTAEYKNYENAAVFIVSTYQYIILAIAFSKGAPYRKSILTNYAFVLNILVCFALSLYLTTYPVNWILERLQLVRIPSIWFILILHSMVLANFMASYIVESIVDGVSFRRRIRRIRRALFPRRVERKAYERIREEIDRSAGVWPPLLRSASLQALPRDLFTDENLDVTTRPRSRRLSSAVSNDTDVDVASVQSEITDRRQLPFSSTDGDIGLHKVVSKHFSNQMSVNENPNQTFTLGGSLKKHNLSVDSLQHHTVYDPDVFDHSSVPSTPSALEVPVIESMSSHLRNEGEENRE
ncbi:unnamed protein product [Schistosoma margrebowiei]|uniref:Cation-transporting ATPase n=3 Tax=Schistosoma margrebowiei TaxID=48269 RepID=A0AA85AJ11_9TREM|nr:unnamed protein product [Schistosoma margrebowiei]